MEGCTHHIVRMTGQDCDLTPVLPVPDADSLIVAGGDNPGQVVMELHSADVVNVTVECEHTLFGLVAPNLNQVVVTSGNKHRLGFVEVYTTYRT